MKKEKKIKINYVTYIKNHYIPTTVNMKKWILKSLLAELPSQINIIFAGKKRIRTLNDAFIILDEAQNTTISKMQMFLTRIGYGSSTVVTGDVSQIDLPHEAQSGLKDCLEFILGINGIDAVHFEPKDVMRHKIVTSIINEYEKRKKNKN